MEIRGRGLLCRHSIPTLCLMIHFCSLPSDYVQNHNSMQYCTGVKTACTDDFVSKQTVIQCSTKPKYHNELSFHGCTFLYVGHGRVKLVN